jgi:cellulose biosynthesis protein BcsQ
MHVATALARLGKVVGGLDLDLRQRSFGRYIENRQNTIAKRRLDLPCPILMELPPIDPATLAEGENIYDKRLSAAVAEHEAKCDLIVIDCPGSHTRLSQVAHSLADTLITPMNDSFVDFDLLARIDPETYEIRGPSVYSEMVWHARQLRARAGLKAMDWIVVRNRLGAQEMHNKRKVGRALEDLSKTDRVPGGAGVFRTRDLPRDVPDRHDAAGSARSWGRAAQHLQSRGAAGTARPDEGAEAAGGRGGFLTIGRPHGAIACVFAER